MAKKRKSSTHDSFGEVKLQLSGIKAPETWEDTLRLIFPDNFTRQNLARVLLQEIKKAADRHEYVTSSDWLPIVIKALKEDPIYSTLGEKLEERWLELERKEVNRVDMVKILTREANELQQKLNIQGSPGFGRYRGAWYVVINLLAKAGIIKKKGAILELSTDFAYRLERIARLWRKFAEGVEEVW